MSDDRMQEAVVHWFRQLPEELFAGKTLVRIPVVISFNTTAPSGFSFTCLMYGGRAGKDERNKWTLWDGNVLWSRPLLEHKGKQDVTKTPQSHTGDKKDGRYIG